MEDAKKNKAESAGSIFRISTEKVWTRFSSLSLSVARLYRLPNKLWHSYPRALTMETEAVSSRGVSIDKTTRFQCLPSRLIRECLFVPFAVFLHRHK